MNNLNRRKTNAMEAAARAETRSAKADEEIAQSMADLMGEKDSDEVAQSHTRIRSEKPKAKTDKP